FDELAKPRAEHGRDIGRALHEIASDPTVFSYYRVSAAELAARLGGQQCEQAATDLESTALDPGVHVQSRSQAAQALAKLGWPWNERYAMQLQALLQQRWISDEDRMVAAAALAWLRPGGVELAATVLLDTAGAGRADAWLRLEIADQLADLGRSWINHAADL